MTTESELTGFCCRRKNDGTTVICEMDHDLFEYFRSNGNIGAEKVRQMKDYIDNVDLAPVQVALAKLYAKYDACKNLSAPNSLITAAEAEFDQQLQNLYWYRVLGTEDADELLGYLDSIEEAVTADPPSIDIQHQFDLREALIAKYNLQESDITDELSTAYWMVTDYEGYSQLQRNITKDDGLGVVIIDPDLVAWLKLEEIAMKTRLKLDSSLANVTLDNLVLISKIGIEASDRVFSDPPSNDIAELCVKYKALVDVSPSPTFEPTVAAANSLHHFFNGWVSGTSQGDIDTWLADATNFFYVMAGSDFLAASADEVTPFDLALRLLALVTMENDTALAAYQINLQPTTATEVANVRSAIYDDNSGAYVNTVDTDTNSGNLHTAAWMLSDAVTQVKLLAEDFAELFDLLAIINLDDPTAFGSYTNNPGEIAGVDADSVVNLSLQSEIDALLDDDGAGIKDSVASYITSDWTLADGAKIADAVYETGTTIDNSGFSASYTATDEIIDPSSDLGTAKVATGLETSDDFASREMALHACPHNTAKCGGDSNTFLFSDKESTAETVIVSQLTEKSSCHYFIRSECDVPRVQIMSADNDLGGTHTVIGASYIEYQAGVNMLSLDSNLYPREDQEISVVVNQFNMPEGTLGEFQMEPPETGANAKRVGGERILRSLASYTKKVQAYEADLESYEEARILYNQAVQEVLDGIKYEDLELSSIPAKPRAPVVPKAYGGFYYGGDSELTPYTGFGKIVAGEMSLNKAKHGQFKHFGVFGQGDSDNLGFAASEDEVDELGEPLCKGKTILLNVYPLSSE